MALRKIVEIDEQKCNGCGECIPNCAEGALQIVDGKARLVKESYCDGLGACLGTCPRDAIRIVEREAEEFDEVAVEEHLGQASPPNATQPAPSHAGCPGLALMGFDAGQEDESTAEAAPAAAPSALRQWPVQMHLVPERAPFLDGADLLLAADCVPFAFAGFHGEFLTGRKLLVGCPKLDDASHYAEKLTAMLAQNDIRSLSVVHMEVPCCSGLTMIARRALEHSGKDIPLQDVTVSIRGSVLERCTLNPPQPASAP